jgi:hypothetical protein
MDWGRSMTDYEDWYDLDGEATPIENASGRTVTVTLTEFEVRVLQVILEDLIAGQSVDPSTLDDQIMRHVERQLTPEPPRNTG